jgi:hypothetical protein
MFDSCIDISSPSNEFLDHLAIIRLDDNRIHQHPPKSVLLETARILFKSVNQFFSINSKSSFFRKGSNSLRAKF